MPEVVLGDRFGAAATREIVSETQIAFEAAGFVVARNAPFAGGYITQRYGRPARRLNAVQIEIDRALYLDQRRIEPNAGYPEIARRIERVIAALCAIEPGLKALAAE
jgi:N-formylglutamate deformylase